LTGCRNVGIIERRKLVEIGDSKPKSRSP